MARQDIIRSLAGACFILFQRKQRLDVIEMESKIPRMLDETQALQIIRFIASLVAFAAICRRNETDLLIISYCWHFHAAVLRELPIVSILHYPHF